MIINDTDICKDNHQVNEISIIINNDWTRLDKIECQTQLNGLCYCVGGPCTTWSAVCVGRAAVSALSHWLVDAYIGDKGTTTVVLFVGFRRGHAAARRHKQKERRHAVSVAGGGRWCHHHQQQWVQRPAPCCPARKPQVCGFILLPHLVAKLFAVWWKVTGYVSGHNQDWVRVLPLTWQWSHTCMF